MAQEKEGMGIEWMIAISASGTHNRMRIEGAAGSSKWQYNLTHNEGDEAAWMKNNSGYISTWTGARQKSRRRQQYGFRPVGYNMLSCRYLYMQQ